MRRGCEPPDGSADAAAAAVRLFDDPSPEQLDLVDEREPEVLHEQQADLVRRRRRLGRSRRKPGAGSSPPLAKRMSKSKWARYSAAGHGRGPATASTRSPERSGPDQQYPRVLESADHEPCG